jgi:ribonucleoside-diphosphate reductase alpha chain
MGDNAIHYLGHVRMMGAVQPFISGAISKTVNMPEEVTVEEVEQLHIDAWKLGIKAVAIYRDNCKVAQPLSMAKSDDDKADTPVAAVAADPVVIERVIEKIVEKVVHTAERERLPRKRKSSTFKFRVADCEGFVHVGEYDDGRPGELFIKVAKQGSTLAGIMDAFGLAISIGLQSGVPLKTYVEKYANTRFEPAGMTDDPDIRFASSLIDYIFRRLAVDYLPLDVRMDMGILSVGERLEPTLPGIEEAVTENTSSLDLVADNVPVKAESIDLPKGTLFDAEPSVVRSPELNVRPANSDAPFCNTCGIQMQRAGSCHACPSCGTTSGCS